MSDHRIQIRRGRRTDFTAVMSLLAASGTPMPPADRAALRRFRYLVADLGADFYLAWIEGTLAGLVHVTYARQLAIPARAQLDELVVSEAFRRRGIGSALLAFAQRRARQRGCAVCSCALPEAAAAIQPFFEKAGFQAVGCQLSLVLDPGEQEMRPAMEQVQG
jgi:GNAT superfamily N-acetyltransferase